MVERTQDAVVFDDTPNPNVGTERSTRLINFLSTWPRVVDKPSRTDMKLLWSWSPIKSDHLPKVRAKRIEHKHFPGACWSEDDESLAQTFDAFGSASFYFLRLSDREPAVGVRRRKFSKKRRSRFGDLPFCRLQVFQFLISYARVIDKRHLTSLLSLRLTRIQ